MANIKKLLQKYIDSPNIAEELEGKDLCEIGKDCKKGFDLDDASRAEWVRLNEKILKLAKLVIEPKTEPWVDASNIKYPLITTAIIQYASRTYPEIVKDGKVVHGYIIGTDPEDDKADIAKRISDFMSYQLIMESTSFEENLDRALHVYPTVGVAWVKTYRDNVAQINESVLCLHDEICINDNVESLEKACRVTHTLRYTKNMILEQIRAGLFCDPGIEAIDQMFKDDEDTTELHEQHCFVDLDDDGYEEPYIITYHTQTQYVFRIYVRYDQDGIIWNKKKEVVRITPIQYFSDIHCIPRLDGKYHSYGIGTLLYHPNCVINTLLNQTVDSGTLANMQGGFIGSGVEIKGGIKGWKPGEWKKFKSLNGTMAKDQIIPLTYKEPSQVIFNCLELMIAGGEKLSSVTDTTTGNADISNAKSGATQLMDANSLKVFTAMQKRLYRGLQSIFDKIFRLNRIYLSDEEYQQFHDDPNVSVVKDFNEKSLRIRPVSDPNLASENQRQQKAQVLSNFMQFDGINKQEIITRMLKALQEPDITKLMEPPAPKTPPPELLKIQMDGQRHVASQHLQQMQLELQQQQFELSVEKARAEIELTRAQAVQALAMADATTKGIPIEALELQLKHLDSQRELAKITVEHDLKKQELEQNAAINARPVDQPSGN